jgi:diacylglycerol kinase (ATP)
MAELLAIYNAEAGSADDDGRAAVIETLRGGADLVEAPVGEKDLDEMLDACPGRDVVVLGGDGTLHVVVATLHRRGELDARTVGLVPLGTGNDFARGADIPLDPEDAARLVLSGTSRPVDLIVDNLGEVVVNNVHIGVGAQASRKSHKWKERLGRIGYVIGALLASVNPPFVRLRVVVDGHVVSDLDRPILQVALGNGSHVGGGTALTPEADPEDGRIDVMVSFAIGPFSRWGYAAMLRRGTHHERDDVLYLRGSEVSISGQPFYCSADGELYGPERDRSWRLEREAFSMVLPH